MLICNNLDYIKNFSESLHVYIYIYYSIEEGTDEEKDFINFGLKIYYILVSTFPYQIPRDKNHKNNK